MITCDNKSVLLYNRWHNKQKVYYGQKNNGTAHLLEPYTKQEVASSYKKKALKKIKRKMLCIWFYHRTECIVPTYMISRNIEWITSCADSHQVNSVTMEITDYQKLFFEIKFIFRVCRATYQFIKACWYLICTVAHMHSCIHACASHHFWRGLGDSGHISF